MFDYESLVSRTIKILNLDKQCTKEDLLEKFKIVGEIESIYI